MFNVSLGQKTGLVKVHFSGEQNGSVIVKSYENLRF
jgi:hypothetical protein